MEQGGMTKTKRGVQVVTDRLDMWHDSERVELVIDGDLSVCLTGEQADILQALLESWQEDLL